MSELLWAMQGNVVADLLTNAVTSKAGSKSNREFRSQQGSGPQIAPTMKIAAMNELARIALVFFVLAQW
jgi:hypothetical protein